MQYPALDVVCRITDGEGNEASIELSPEDRARLDGWAAGQNTPQKLVWRARIVLLWRRGRANLRPPWDIRLKR